MKEIDDTSPEPDGDDLVREITIVSLVVFALVLAASIAAQFIGFVAQSLYLIVAVVFIYVPYWLLERKRLSFRDFGLETDRLWRNVGIGLGFLAVTALPFFGGFYLWETYAVGHSYEFEWENFRKWNPQYQGRPDRWGEQGPGVWAWTDDRQVHLGMRTGRAGRIRATLTVDRPVVPDAVGPVEVAPAGAEAGEVPEGGWKPAREWRIFLKAPHKRAEVTLEPSGHGTAGFPTKIAVSMRSPTDEAGLYVGPSARRVDGGEVSFGRNLRWIALWLITQVAFIALPEEFFYRGYLQTRIGQAIGARREEDEESTIEGTRSWFGVSEENLVASALFGVAHLLIPVGGQIMVNRISVFFPAIVFGWLRERTGTITASVVYHAGCNMLVLLAAPHFF